jgi:methylphosphotriester-DNA--protein-cysteine methyltransferase
MEMENQELKRSIAKMKDLETVRMEQNDRLKESSKLSGSGLYSGVQMNVVAENRQRFIEEFNRINDNTNRRYNAAAKENSELKKKISSMEGNF